MAGGKKQTRRTPAKRPPGPKPAPATPKKTQAQRLEEARRARARKSRNIRLGIAGGAVLVAGLLVANTLGNKSDTNALRRRLTAGTCTFDTRSDRTSAGTAKHVAPAGYEVDPPAGGNHDPVAPGAGTFTEATAPSDQRIVHALEHGYIAVWHQPGLDEAAMATLTNAVDAYRRDVLVVPRASLSGQVALTAWGERLLCPTVETGPIQEFIDAYANKGPERIEHPPV